MKGFQFSTKEIGMRDLSLSKKQKSWVSIILLLHKQVIMNDEGNESCLLMAIPSSPFLSSVQSKLV